MRVAILALLFLTVCSFAEDFVAINSMDGRDVLSGVYYANVKGLPVKFVPYPGGDADLFAAKVGPGHDILLIQGTIPVTGLVESTLQANNNTIQKYISTDGLMTNLDLARRSGASSFIIVDSAYADGALSVLSYAALTQSYVLLTNKENIDEVRQIVSGRKITIYGYVDEEVRIELASMNPEIIGQGQDKFEDNIAIVRKMLSDEFGIKRVIITDGSYIEESMINPIPILLSGRLVPSPTYSFVKQQVREDKLKEVRIMGSNPQTSLFAPVYDMQKRIQNELMEEEGLNKTFLLSLMIAQMVPGMNSGALNLDTFPLPKYSPYLNMSEVIYNSEGKTLMITMDNLGSGAAYYVIETRVLLDGSDFTVLTAGTPRLIERSDAQGTEFSLDLSSVAEGNITVFSVAKYGTSKDSLGDFAYYNGELTTISYVDDSDVGAQSAKYDREQKTLLVTLRNKGAETAYVSSKLQLSMDGSLVNVSSPATRELEAGSMFVEHFPLELSENDISANKDVTVFLQYGARKGFLKKEGEHVLPLEEAGFPILYVGLFILALLAGYYLYNRKKK